MHCLKPGRVQPVQFKIHEIDLPHIPFSFSSIKLFLLWITLSTHNHVMGKADKTAVIFVMNFGNQCFLLGLCWFFLLPNYLLFSPSREYSFSQVRVSWDAGCSKSDRKVCLEGTSGKCIIQTPVSNICKLSLAGFSLT